MFEYWKFNKNLFQATINLKTNSHFIVGRILTIEIQEIP